MGLFRRSLLAVSLGLGVMAGLARAQDPGMIMTIPEPPGCPGQAMAEGDGQPPKQCHSVLAAVNPVHVTKAVCKCVGEALNLTCYGDFNDYACGSLKSEVHFVFGSCRKFYGERCVRGGPVSPVPGFNPHTLTYDPYGVEPPAPQRTHHWLFGGSGDCGCR